MNNKNTKDNDCGCGKSTKVLSPKSRPKIKRRIKKKI